MSWVFAISKIPVDKYYPSIYIGPAVSYNIESKYFIITSTANKHYNSFPWCNESNLFPYGWSKKN
jgi:hypothetical protein